MREKNNINSKDLELIKFLSKYKMLKVEDASLIYNTKRYYRQRVNNLINKEYIKRYKSYVVIDKKGRKVLNEVGSGYIKNMQNLAYMERLKNISSIATLSINSNIEFIPSWDIKEKDKFTETARRYIGKIIKEGNEYLTYYISEQKEHLYIKQLLFDINKSINYDEIIIFIDNYNVICSRYSNLSFGKKNTYLILNTSENKKILRETTVSTHELLEELYETEILISNWDKADYLLEDGRYILYMPFINSEKLQRLNWYYKENTESIKKIELVTLKENENKIKEILSDKCKIVTFDKNLLGG